MTGLDPCDCGSGRGYATCCGPLHLGAAQADTPEQLMRSRYSAFVRWLPDYLVRTWHPRTRPEQLAPVPGVTWTGLQILDASGDQVEFIAHSLLDGEPVELHERSSFVHRAGRWFYLDGQISPAP